MLVIALERKLPHKKMLVATGLLITWVLVVMVGTTVQTMQKVGWVAVTPIEGLELPYWMGLWLGIFPTWQGVLAQVAARRVRARELRRRRGACGSAGARHASRPSLRQSTLPPVEPVQKRRPTVEQAPEPVGTR